MYRRLCRRLCRRSCRRLCRRSCRRSCRFVGTFVGVLGARSGSIMDGIYKIGDELLNSGISELSSAILGVEV